MNEFTHVLMTTTALILENFTKIGAALVICLQIWFLYLGIRERIANRKKVEKE